MRDRSGAKADWRSGILNASLSLDTLSLAGVAKDKDEEKQAGANNIKQALLITAEAVKWHPSAYRRRQSLS